MEIERFLDNFTINYSYFFRNYEIFKRIGELLEKYQLTKNSLIKVWSCPCANGEEPYSLAILFEELKAENSDFPEYKIVASDINSQAIKKAKKGIYGKHALREIPPQYLKKYFTKISNSTTKYQINQALRNKVEFINEDITICHEKSQKYDIILCRNFIIYINLLSRNHLIRNLKTYLNDGGFLILGKTERLNGQKTFKLVDPTNHIYVKGELPNLKEGNEKRIQRLKDLANLETRINDKIMDKYKTISLQEKDDDLQPSEISIKKESPEEEPDKEIIKSNPIKKPKNLINISNILSKPSKSEIYEQQIAELEKFRTRINKELFFLKQQRKKLNEAILKFEEEKKEFQEQKKDFENTLLLFEKERRFIKKKWESYEMKNELLRIEKEMFKKQVEKFQHKIKNFEKYKNRKGSSENHISEAKVLKYGYKEEDHILPLGQYVISSSKDSSKHIPKKISINGIGSTYILILCDNLNQIYAMSHIMYLKPRKGQKKDELTNKHQYAQFCVPFLTKKMLINGASEKLTACIIGGAQIFNKKYNSVERILEKLKSELKKYNISIQKEHIGGAYPRDIKLNIKKKRILIQFGSNKKEIKL